MLRISLIFTGLMFFFTELQGEESDTLWSYSGTTRVNFSDVGLHQWAGGGDNSTSLNAMLNIQTTRTGRISEWDTRLRTGYGVTRLGERSNPYRKTDDFLIFYSGYGRMFTSTLSKVASVDFRTQFQNGYRYDADERHLTSKFMAPAYLVTSLGIEYEPYDQLTVTFSPISGKTTFILHEDIRSIAEMYGLDSGEHIKHEFGMSFSSYFSISIMENIRLDNQLLLFSAFEAPEKVDINWEAMLSLRVNDYITANVTTHLIYDDDILIQHEDGSTGKGTQFKRAISAGFAYDIF